MNYHEKLSKRIEDILSSVQSLSLSQIRKIDFEGKDATRERRDEEGLENSLVAARGYEIMGRDCDKERAYCLDRAGKCMDYMFGTEHKINCLHKLYAKFKAKAGELFFNLTKDNLYNFRFYRDAGFSYLRAALAYASMGEIDKAKEYLDKSDEMFEVAGHKEGKLRKSVITKIEGK